MITIFTTCRTFENSTFNLIQRNALKSWTLLQPQPEILVMGNDPGTKDICQEFNLKHIPDVKVSKFNTPMLDHMFSLAEEQGQYDTLLLLASDTIIFQDTINACKELQQRFETFCGGVRRHELHVTDLINFSNPEWYISLQSKSIPGHPGAGDYFLYSKGLFKDMPPFMIGRSRVDNWMYYHTIQKKSLVNMTSKVFTIHQSHGHPHLGSDNPRQWLQMPEFKINEALTGGHGKSIADANWTL